MAGRYGWIVNPAGYHTVIEHGANGRWTGQEMFQRGWLTQKQGFWLAPRSEWVMARPRNFDGDWFKSAGVGAFADHVIHKSLWSLASGLAIDDFSFSRTPDENIVPDIWMNFGAMPAAITGPPIDVSLTALFDAADDLTLPTGMEVIAATNSSISGVATPYLEMVRFPRPQDLLVFGFGDMCLIVSGHQGYLLRTPANDHQTWVLLGKSGQRYRPGGTSDPVTGDGGIGFDDSTSANFVAFSSQPNFMSVGVIPVGWNNLYLMARLDAEPWSVQTREDPPESLKDSGDPLQIKSGPWWIAAYPGQKVILQVQSMAYTQPAEAAPPNPVDSNTEWFNLGPSYTPAALPVGGWTPDGTVGPFVTADGLIASVTGRLETDPSGPGFDTIDGVSFAEVKVEVRDETNTTWASNGLHFNGAMYVKILAAANPIPYSAGALYYAYCASPQIREIQVRFPPVLQELGGSPLLLDDTMFMPEWTASASLNDTDSKQITIPLTAAGAYAMTLAGYNDRHDIPLHFCQDTTLDATYASIYIRGWIVEPQDETELTQLAPPYTGTPAGNFVTHGVIHARAQVSRMDLPWVYMQTIVDPINAGKLTHDKAVAEALCQSGIRSDGGDTYATVFIGDDSGAPDDIRLLPGGIRGTNGNADQVTHPSAYAPAWDETMGSYAKRVGQEWRGWLFYEDLNGGIWYRRDPFDDILDFGATLAADAEIFQNRVIAAANGENHGQFYMDLSEATIKPVEANRIRVIPAFIGAGQTTRQKITTDQRSLSDPSYENYVGHIRCKVIAPTKAVNDLAQNQLAVVALRRFGRKQRTRRWRIPIAAWEVTSGGTVANAGRGLDVGSIVLVQDHAYFRVVHLEVEQLGPFVFHTTFTGEVLPAIPP